MEEKELKKLVTELNKYRVKHFSDIEENNIPTYTLLEIEAINIRRTLEELKKLLESKKASKDDSPPDILVMKELIINIMDTLNTLLIHVAELERRH